MKVLHYMFGLPPVYGGGLVRYALDLMKQEMCMGQEVVLLIPGSLFTCIRKKLSIWRAGGYQKIPIYSICNPLPVPMCNGILDIDMYCQPCDAKAYDKFLKQKKPDVIHIHSFMGLHAEFLKKAVLCGIPVIFTTHDYFGICPTANMLLQDRICSDKEWNHCEQCCKNAYTKKKLWLEHSKLYRCYRKQTWLVKCFHYTQFQKNKYSTIKKDIRDKKDTRYKKETVSCCTEKDYAKLKNYYQMMFRQISYFHFNSSVAKGIYESRLGSITGKTVPVSHAGICDNRIKRSYGKALRIGFFGTWTKQKGFYQLLDVCTQLFQEKHENIRLHVYSDFCRRTEPFIQVHPYFKKEELAGVMRDIDVLVVPSIWPETFGFTALEALSYGVPVIVSQYAGVKDLLEKYPGIGFLYDGTQLSLKEILKKIYNKREMLKTANTKILNMQNIFSFENHVKQILEMYRRMM